MFTTTGGTGETSSKAKAGSRNIQQAVAGIATLAFLAWLVLSPSSGATVGSVHPSDAVVSGVANVSGAWHRIQPGDRRADTKKLLEVMGARGMLDEVMGKMIGLLLETIKASQFQDVEIPQKALNDLGSAITEEIRPHLGEMIELSYSIYERHLTAEEVRELTTFFQSALGRKLVAVSPQIQKEVMAAGYQWGRNLRPRVKENLERRLQKLGYK